MLCLCVVFNIVKNLCTPPVLSHFFDDDNVMVIFSMNFEPSEPLYKFIFCLMYIYIYFINADQGQFNDK